MHLVLVLLFLFTSLFAGVKVGVDVFFEEEKYVQLIQGKKIGLITNHTAVNKDLITTLELFRAKTHLVAVFAPEHGLYGDVYADKDVENGNVKGVPVYSLHGKTRRPTPEMLKGLDLLVFDIQDIGSRSYTYISTLFYCMEEAAKVKLPVLVLDRPNPLGGLVVDGPGVDSKWRSFLGYVNVPYCHGMTAGELATLFNEEYHVGAKLLVVPMKGWKRRMTFHDTGLAWMPTSPQIPEGDSAFFYPATGIIGQLSLTSIGIGYTLPFKVVGAPWIQADSLAAKLNELKLPGVAFTPFHFKPFFGKFRAEVCKGVKIVITDPVRYKPVTTQYSILGILKTSYPEQFKKALDEMLKSSSKKEIFNKLNGSEEILHILTHEKTFIWKLRARFQKDIEAFLPIRKKYLNVDY